MFSTEQANRANYATAGTAIAILLTRIIVGRWRRRPIDLALFLLLASIVAISFRISLNYYVLRDGTNVVRGSKIILASRTAITASLWLQICLLLLFYSQILQGIQWIRVMIRLTWVGTGLSFVGVTLATLLECHPFHLYWQIAPPPGNCIKAYGQLLSQYICNIILDLMLLAISFLILLSRGRSWTQHLRVGGLFMLGTFSLVVTIMRLTAVYGNKGQKPARTLWGAVQIIVSTFVANAPTIYGDIRLIRKRKEDSRKRSLSRPESWSRSGAEEEGYDEEQTSDAQDQGKSYKLGDNSLGTDQSSLEQGRHVASLSETSGSSIRPV